MPEERWEDVLFESLHAIRSLVCLATNETPHNRMFKFDRRSMTGVSMPSWLLHQGPVYLRKFVRCKGDSLCERAYLIDANPSYAHIRLQDGRESTVSTSDLAPLPESLNVDQDTIFSRPDLNVPAVDVNDVTRDSSLSNDNDNSPSLLPEAENNTNRKSVVSDVSDEVIPVVPRRSNRIRRPPERYGECAK